MSKPATTKPLNTKPPFRYYLRVRYHECDTQRVVFNGHYGTYVDMALTEFMTALLPDRHAIAQQQVDGTQLEFQLVKQVIEWKAPARFNDIVEISAWCGHVGTTSFVMRYELRKPLRLGQPGEAEPFVTAETVNVVVDGVTWTKKAIDAELRDKLLTGAPGLVIDHAGYRAGR